MVGFVEYIRKSLCVKVKKLRWKQKDEDPKCKPFSYTAKEKLETLTPAPFSDVSLGVFGQNKGKEMCAKYQKEKVVLCTKRKLSPKG